MTDWNKLAADWEMPSKANVWADPDNQAHACNCIGPQQGAPLCPCRMRNVHVVDGRYVETIDHGPATARSRA